MPHQGLSQSCVFCNTVFTTAESYTEQINADVKAVGPCRDENTVMRMEWRLLVPFSYPCKFHIPQLRTELFLRKYNGIPLG